ncbi:MAG: 16S rRNA (adenine(1518)-N(6)/adenine(1519)-N(6))-dimethyltransferase RsmA [Oscillospiraceae bacterium]|nr:16S rRNA (adenine(1518)-N(6)/adenine(1519)-N(6))-dimethyltransferase RsmA [Oscillospiraceae bacterium]
MELTNIYDIRALLDRHGFRFSKALGQNFLIADWVPRDIADSAMLGADVGVLEIGPGIGCLTNELSHRVGKVVSVELDKSLKPILAETLADLDNVTVVYGDILKQDVTALVSEHFSGLRPAVCANLPYNVTSPVLTKLIESGCFESITVMIQREVARRICAAPNTADYGAFGIFVQWHMHTQPLFDVPPYCFIPQPKVTSSVIRLTRREAPPANVRDEQLLFKIIRAAFNQRRKTLVNALSGPLGLEKAALEALITSCGLDARVRGEALDVTSFAAICEKISDLYMMTAASGKNDY